MGIFTSQGVLDVIAQFSKTARGKREINSYIKNMGRTREFVPRYWDKKAVERTIKQTYRAAEDMADILYRHIISDTVTTGRDADGNTYERVGLSGFNRSDIHVHHPYKVAPGQYRCNISINVSALHRDSLLPDKYEGIDDIISLFVHGYSNAKASVHGEWHGREITTPRTKPANRFLQNAVDEFNAKYKKKAVATVSERYSSKAGAPKGGGGK